MSMRAGCAGGRHFLRILLMVASASLFSGAGPVLADIRDTKHNLARLPGQADRDVDAREVCVYCHFPRVGEEGTDASPAGGPLWQRAANADREFPIYDDNGRVDLDKERPVGSPSVACLSCHDANQALAVTQGKRGDHPFGVPYAGSRQAHAVLDESRWEALRAGMPGRIAAPPIDREDFRPPSETTHGTRRIFWASAQPSLLRRGKEDLPLFGRLMTDSGETIPFVECSSCHDPHAARQLFLRVANDSGALCMTCHQK